MSEDQNPGAIFKAIQAVMLEVEAIPKDRTNVGQGFKFRGIDDVYNSLHPLLAKHGVFSTSTILNRSYSESTSKSGTTMVERILSIRYRFYATDGSFVETEVDGEAMDSGDKTSNKAMAVAHKYALMQLFCIPTADEKDTDLESPERATGSREKPYTKPIVVSGDRCPSCSGALEERTSGPQAKNPGKKYLLCPKCPDDKGKPGKFIKFVTAGMKPPPGTMSAEEMEERQQEIAETSGHNEDLRRAHNVIDKAMDALAKAFPDDAESRVSVIQQLFACKTIEAAKQALGPIEVARALKDHLVPTIADVKKEKATAIEEGA